MLEPAFVTACPYQGEALLVDDIVEVDKAQNRVVVRVPTHADLPLTRDQRACEKVHPRHFSGGLVVHVTGIVAFAHFYYVLDLDSADGWAGYGVRIKNARFHKLIEPPVPLLFECKAERIRRLNDKISAVYQFRATQDDTVVYESTQSAMWVRTRVG